MRRWSMAREMAPVPCVGLVKKPERVAEATPRELTEGQRAVSFPEMYVDRGPYGISGDPIGRTCVFAPTPNHCLDVYRCGELAAARRSRSKRIGAWWGSDSQVPHGNPDVPIDPRCGSNL